MAVYLGKNTARIAYSSQPVFVGEKRIRKIFAGGQLIYPETAEYRLAEWYCHPEQNHFNQAGMMLVVGDEAEITDAVVFYKYDSALSGSIKSDSIQYAYSCCIAVKGKNLTPVRTVAFDGYYGGSYTGTDAGEDFEGESGHLVRRDDGLLVWTTGIYQVLWFTKYGDKSSMARGYSDDLRLVRSEEELNQFIYS